MTETSTPTPNRKGAAATAGKTRQAPKHVPDPTFEVMEERPKDIVTARGLNAPPSREQLPLTKAVLATIGTTKSVRIKYAKDAHDRLMSRFKGIESRQKQELKILYSFETGDDSVPTHVRYWVEQVPKPAPVPPPTPPPSSEARVGVDVE